jgi:hypothetical protein
LDYLFSVEERPDFLHVRISGVNTADNVRRYLRDTYEAAARTGIRSVLIEEDLRGPAIGAVEVYRVASDASAQTSPIIQKIAYVDLHASRSPSNIELAVAVARDRGVNVRAFDAVSAAEVWLASEHDSPGH